MTEQRREKKTVLYDGGQLLVHRLSAGEYQEIREKRPSGMWVLLVPAADLEEGRRALRESAAAAGRLEKEET